jgi:tRNA(adenine34) deaminase
MLAATTDEALQLDRSFMEAALAAARRAAHLGEVPIGAVIVRAARIIGCGHNAPIASSDPTAHAEIVALRAAARAEGNYRLPGTVVYVTVEPCAMCVGALQQARVAGVVYGCREPKAGALGSVCDLGWDTRGRRSFAVRGGVCAAEASILMQDFFRARRGA